MLRVLPLCLRATAVASVAACALTACQPVEFGGGRDASEEPSPETAPPEAARQGAAVPDDLGTLLARVAEPAREWQAEPVVAEVFVGLDGDAVREATVTYVAPDSDRLLVVQVGPQGTRQQRPTLATLALQPVPAEALAQVPPAGDLMEPVELVERAAPALEDCGVGEVASVLYATGAPAAWDGQTWTEPPAWTAMLAGEERAAVVDPLTGEPAAEACVDAA